ncbi:hypothetical protein F2P56_002577, partial [Juglans regia]
SKKSSQISLSLSLSLRRKNKNNLSQSTKKRNNGNGTKPTNGGGQEAMEHSSRGVLHAEKRHMQEQNNKRSPFDAQAWQAGGKSHGRQPHSPRPFLSLELPFRRRPLLHIPTRI